MLKLVLVGVYVATIVAAVFPASLVTLRAIVTIVITHVLVRTRRWREQGCACPVVLIAARVECAVLARFVELDQPFQSLGQGEVHPIATAPVCQLGDSHQLENGGGALVVVGVGKPTCGAAAVVYELFRRTLPHVTHGGWVGEWAAVVENAAHLASSASAVPYCGLNGPLRNPYAPDTTLSA